MNLFTVAAANIAHLEERFEQIKSALKPADLASVVSFVQLVQKYGLVGINMRQTTLIIFLTTGEYQNIYGWASFVSSVSHKSVDDSLRKKLDKFHERRLLFDNSFDNGDRFYYGALVTSGPGATSYGNYCVVLASATNARVDLAYLIADSIKTYVLAGPTLDTKAIVEDAAVEQSKHFLAGVKHHRTIPTMPEADWGVLLCNKDDFIEAIFDDSISPDDIEEVRVQKADHDRYYHFAFDDFRAATKLKEGDRALVEDFAFVIKLLKTKGIRLEVV